MTSSNNRPVGPFFTENQIAAMNAQPEPNHIQNLQGNPYLKGKYVIGLLNNIIGQGNWTTSVVHIATDVTHIEKSVTRNNNTTLVPTYYVGVHQLVTLTIRAADGSGREISFTEPGVGDGECPADRNPSTAIDKAATSATTAGLKRCARLLGDAFGLTLGETSNQSGYNRGGAANNQSRPFQQRPAATNTNQASNNAPRPNITNVEPTTGAGPRPNTPTTPTPANPAKPVTPAKAPVAQTTHQTAPSATTSTPTQTPTPIATSPATNPVAEKTYFDDAAAKAVPIKAVTNNPTSGSPAPTPPVAQTPTASTNGANPSAQGAELSNWNLDMTPKTEDEWKRCARQLREKIEGAKHARTLEALIDQRRHLFTDIPNNFQSFLFEIVDRRFQTLGSSVTTNVIFKTRKASAEPTSATQH